MSDLDDIRQALKKKGLAPPATASSSSDLDDIRAAFKGNGIQDVGVSRLQGENSRMNAKVALAGGEPAQESPGVLSRIMDVLSRFNYAGANATKHVQDAIKTENPDMGVYERGVNTVAESTNPFLALVRGHADDWLKGAALGFTGKEKTTFGDVLENGGVTNPIVKGVGGLVLDIGLDPTTYVGAGLLRNAGEEVVEQVAIKGFGIAHESADAIKAGKAARRAALQAQKAAKKTTKASSKAPKGGIDLTVKNIQPKPGKLSRAALNDIEQSARVRFALNQAGVERNLAKMATRGHVQFKFGGKTFYNSHALYKTGTKIGDVLGATAAGQVIKKGFRTSTLFPGRTNFLKRLHEGRSAAEFEEFAKDWRKIADEFTVDERVRVSHAIEEGIDLSGQKGLSGADLGDLQLKAKSIFKELFDEESLHYGLMDEADEISNYVYHIYKAKNKAKINRIKRQRKTFLDGNFGPAMQREAKITLREAKLQDLNPVEDISEIIAHRVAKSYRHRSRVNFIADISREYGVKIPAKAKQARQAAESEGWRNIPGYEKYVDPDLFFPEPITRVLTHVERVYDHEDEMTDMLRIFDQVQNIWKTGATVVNPGHHVRNMIGDMWLNYLDGVTNPAVYKQGIGIVWGDRGNVTVRIGNDMLDGHQINTYYEKLGLKSGFIRAELGANKNAAINAIRNIAEDRETVGRLAHFIDAFKKEAAHIPSGLSVQARKRMMDQAAEKAAVRVRKWNIDYGDLTRFEQRVMKRVLPFYTFMRKNLPLQLEAVAMRPGRVVALPKAQRAIEMMLGTNRTDARIEETIPQWLKEQMPTQLTGGQSPMFLAPGLPINDLNRFSGSGPEMVRNLVSQATPIGRIPAEYMLQEQMFSGAPIQNGAGQYAAEQVPFAALARIWGMNRDRPMSDKLTRTANYLTGTGLQQVTPDKQKGELQRQRDIISALLRKAREVRGQ